MRNIRNSVYLRLLRILNWVLLVILKRKLTKMNPHEPRGWITCLIQQCTAHSILVGTVFMYFQTVTAGDTLSAKRAPNESHLITLEAWVVGDFLEAVFMGAKSMDRILDFYGPTCKRHIGSCSRSAVHWTETDKLIAKPGSFLSAIWQFWFRRLQRPWWNAQRVCLAGLKNNASKGWMRPGVPPGMRPVCSRIPPGWRSLGSPSYLLGAYESTRRRTVSRSAGILGHSFSEYSRRKSLLFMLAVLSANYFKFIGSVGLESENLPLGSEISTYTARRISPSIDATGMII